MKWPQVVGQAQPAQAFCPPPGEAVLVPHVTVLDDIPAHLAVANLPQAQEPWIVLSDQPPSGQSFARYSLFPDFLTPPL